MSVSAQLNTLVTAATKDSTKGVAGLVFQAIDRNGKVIDATAAGVRGLDNADPMTVDTTFWIASCTKMVTAIALMQLVEQGKADLDSADQLESVLPELKDIKVLEDVDADGNEKLREKKGRITLRMLMTHTSGFSYTFFSNLLWNRIRQNPALDEFQCDAAAYQQPLLFDPGTDYKYSLGIDWVGIFIERVTSLSLEDYFQRHIFDPLGIKNTAFIPNPHMRDSLASMHARDADSGELRPIPHILKTAQQAVGVEDAFQSGGGGLMSNAPEYCQIIATLLNDGTSPRTSTRILTKASVDAMFTNQLPQWLHEYAHRGHEIARPDLASIALGQDVPATGKQGWGLNFLLLGENLQRGTAPGISNCYWALDRERGVGGILLSQILPVGDPVVFGLWEGLQQVLFQDEAGTVGPGEG